MERDKKQELWTKDFIRLQEELQRIPPRFYSCVNSVVFYPSSQAFQSHPGLIGPAPVLTSLSSSVKTSSKKAEKNKKTAGTAPNGISDGEGQSSPVAGERAAKFTQLSADELCDIDYPHPPTPPHIWPHKWSAAIVATIASVPVVFGFRGSRRICGT